MGPITIPLSTSFCRHSADSLSSLAAAVAVSAERDETAPATKCSRPSQSTAMRTSRTRRQKLVDKCNCHAAFAHAGGYTLD
jgi:hypothetical protein